MQIDKGYYNRVYHLGRLQIQLRYVDKWGLMLSPALYFGKGHAIGFSIEWIKFFVAVGISCKTDIK